VPTTRCHNYWGLMGGTAKNTPQDFFSETPMDAVDSDYASGGRSLLADRRGLYLPSQPPSTGRTEPWIKSPAAEESRTTAPLRSSGSP
jgi:hypothetical protein